MAKFRRFIPAIWGIFGHGNVSGLSQALWEHGDESAVLSADQRAVHGARRLGLSREHGLRMQTFRLYDIDRSRRNQYGYRRCYCPH